jgi:hypothetical protein
MILAMAGLLFVSLSVSPADVTGRWEGTVVSERSDGSTNEDGALLILTQKGTTITGSIGGGDNDQFPITSGSIDGNRITIAATAQNGRDYLVELTVEGDELKGTVTSGERQAEVRARKRKE